MQQVKILPHFLKTNFITLYQNIWYLYLTFDTAIWVLDPVQWVFVSPFLYIAPSVYVSYNIKYLYFYSYAVGSTQFQVHWKK